MVSQKRTLDVGRIGQIIESLRRTYSIELVRELETRQKLDALCAVLEFEADQFDVLLAANPPVLRTIRGHAFENFFDRLLEDAGYKVIRIGGDKGSDRQVNGYHLQLKTPYSAGTKGGLVSYKTHKTHGAKSERESVEYYHLVDEFADFLIGLVSYEPLNIVVIPRNQLPRHAKEAKRIMSPFGVPLQDYVGVTSLEMIGVDPQRLGDYGYLLGKGTHELLPLTARAIGLNTDIILDTILSGENFRIWDMSIRGFAAEAAFQFLLGRNRVEYKNPLSTGRARADKADLVLTEANTDSERFFQIKGPSMSRCVLDGRKSVVDVETQLTRGRVNDHATQSRLYLRDDWEYLIISLMPPVAEAYRAATKIAGPAGWEHYAVPTDELKMHHIIGHRIAAHQKFSYVKLQNRKITHEWLERWRKGKSEQLLLTRTDDSVVGDD